MTHFEEVTNKLAPGKLYQISMDGPKVKSKFYKEVEPKRTESFYHSFIDMGTCSLHSVHSAVKSVVESTSWGTKNLLKCGFNLLHDLPSWRRRLSSGNKIKCVPITCTFVPLDGWRTSVL